jgi:hypothetical protein
MITKSSWDYIGPACGGHELMVISGGNCAY